MEPRFEPIRRRFEAGNQWYVFDFMLDEFSSLFKPYRTKEECQKAINTYLRHISKHELRKQNHNVYQRQGHGRQSYSLRIA